MNPIYMLPMFPILFPLVLLSKWLLNEVIYRLLDQWTADIDPSAPGLPTNEEELAKFFMGAGLSERKLRQIG